MSSLLFTIGQGLRNLRRNRVFTLASVATIAICLFLFGLFYAIMMNMRSVVKSAEEGVSVTAFFDPGVTEDEILAFKVALEEREEVSEVVYISADQAWADFKEDYLGEYSEGFLENPLEDCGNLQIYLNDVSKQQELVDYLNSVEIVDEPRYSETTATVLTGFNRLAIYVYLGIVIVLLGISIFLISNTVTIGIAVRSEEISIMKYVGATDFFVRAPFVIESIIIGLLGAAIPIAGIWLLYDRAVEYIRTTFSMLTQFLNFLPVEQIMNRLAPICLLLGIGIGFFGSVLTVRKHIRV